MAIADIIYAPQHRASGEFDTRVSASRGIDVLLNTLSEANWTAGSVYYAGSFMPCPFGAPTIGSATLGPFCYIGGKAYVFYAPGDPVPSGRYGDFQIVPVLLGYTISESLINLIGEITATSVFTASWGAGGINLVAKTPGTIGNNIFIAGNPAWVGPTSYSYGGGASAISRSQKDLDITSANDAHWELKAITNTPNPAHLIELTLIPDTGGSIVWRIANGHYRVMACDYQLALAAYGPFEMTDLYATHSELLLSVPFVPQGFATVTAAAFMLRGQNLTLGKGNPFQLSTIILNNYFLDNAGQGQTGVSLNMYRYPGTFSYLRTRTSREIYQPALVSLRPGSVGNETRLVGYLWDSVISSKWAQPPTIITEENMFYRAFLAQRGSDDTEGTLYMRSLR